MIKKSDMNQIRELLFDAVLHEEGIVVEVCTHKVISVNVLRMFCLGC